MTKTFVQFDLVYRNFRAARETVRVFLKVLATPFALTNQCVGCQRRQSVCCPNHKKGDDDIVISTLRCNHCIEYCL